jgi:hypothetical protein
VTANQYDRGPAMGKTNGAVEPADEGDDYDWGAPTSREVLQALIASSRGRQGRPAELTPEEQLLTRDECEHLLDREREAEAAFNKAKADEEHIKWQRWALRINTLLFIAALALELSAYADWLPEALATRDMQYLYVFVAGITSVHGILGFLDVRATRLGTKRAIKQFDVAKRISSGSFVLLYTLCIGGLLFFIGAILYDTWISGRPLEYVILFFVSVILAKLLIFPFLELLDMLGRTALICTLVVFGLLLAAYAASVFYVMRPNFSEAGLLMAVFHGAFFLLFPWPLYWGLIAAVSRLRAVLAASNAEAE